MPNKLLSSLVATAMLVSTSSVVWADAANQAVKNVEQKTPVISSKSDVKSDAVSKAAPTYQKAGMAAGQTQASNQGIGILNTPAIIGIAAVAATVGIALQAASDDDKDGTGTGTSTSGT